MYYNKLRIAGLFLFYLGFISVPETAYSQEITVKDSINVTSDTIAIAVDTTGALNDTIAIRGEVNNFEDEQIFVLNDTIRPEVLDSIMGMSSRSIQFTSEEAIKYISMWYNDRSIWNSAKDPLREAMGRYLYEATHDQFYISEWYIDAFEWDNIKIPSSNFFEWDTIHVAMPVKAGPPISYSDSVLSDTTLLASGAAGLRDTTSSEAGVVRDSLIIIISDTLDEVISTNREFPFNYYNYPMTGDSIQMAMHVLKEFTHSKDSARVVFFGSENSVPVWLSDNPDNMTRLWLKNEWDEELSLWIGSPSRDSVKVIVEKGVHFRRPNKDPRIAGARIDLQEVDNSKLADPKEILFTPQYWKFMSEASFVFNQALIKNWSKGGESNISTLIDVTGTVDYTNKAEQMKWTTIGRFKYGLLMSGEYSDKKNIDIRKNIDQIDISSKFTNKAFGKFDFSATMIFLTQLAKGYNYPNDSVVVSKFFNPASFTIGLGLDYKPNKNTSINFAPLSYKATFVPDTALIDQTKHGLAIDQRSKHEPGMSVQMSHKMELWEKIDISNKVRLFTNYINNPLNIDIEWEMIATAKLNWFTDVRLNTHLIYDDDTLIPVTDDSGEPVLGTDGKQRKVPMTQFKEVIGISIIFRF